MNLLVPKVHRYTLMIGERELIIETGKLAQQAGGSVVVRMGDTMLFCSATMSRNVREGIDFFPLSVDYEEKLYAAGKIPGSFMRREGRPSDRSVLVGRVIDRTLRPLFPSEMLNEVQVILTSLSHDQENSVDMMGIIAASTAVMISDVPWGGPVAGVRIGLIDGELVVNPTIPELVNSRLDLRVSGTKEAINMVECNASEVDEDTMLAALALAHETIKPLIAIQERIREEIGKPKSDYVKREIPGELEAEVITLADERTRAIILEHSDRDARKQALEALETDVVTHFDTKNANLAEGEAPANIRMVKAVLDKVLKQAVRERIVNDGIRPDGRDTTTIRPLFAEVGLVPRVHGSGLFQRGETQVLTVATLGTPRDSQMVEDLDDLEETKRYIHHYNFPPYSTGETAPLRGPRRREIGHGALAENALLGMIPPEDVFPYTIRLVSEVMSSNGSTSMASVCGSTLALMDAGVPIKNPVAGIAMGLIKEGDKVAVLTDIQGLEDHLGDMDFKVAGTRNGITALQMDIKISGVTPQIMQQALTQAHNARLQVLEVMLNVLPAPRPELNDYAPRMITMKIDPEKIGAVIGPGGKTVRGIQEATGVTIDIQEDGTVFIAGPNGPAVYLAKDRVRALVEDAELGAVYTGKITRLETYGVFVEFLPGKEGMVHVSQLADHRIQRPSDEFNIGDEIMIMVTDVEPSGRVRLSRQAVLEGWTIEEARNRDRSGGGGSGGRSGGGNRSGGGGNYERRGGDRSGGGDRPSGGGNRTGGDRPSGGGNREGGSRSDRPADRRPRPNPQD